MLSQLLIISAVVFIFLSLLIIVGVTLYDLHDIKARLHFARHPRARRYRHYPLVTVIVQANGDRDTLRQCMQSILKNLYRHIEIIVIDTLSHNQTRTSLKPFTTSPKRPVRLFKSRRKPLDAIQTAFRRYGNGELVLLLDGASNLDSRAIHHLVWHFNRDEQVNIVTLNARLLSNYSTAGLLRKYEQSLVRLWRKTESAFNTAYIPQLKNISYRRSTLLNRSAFGNKTLHSYYADDVVVYKDGIQSLPSLLIQQARQQKRHLQGLVRHRHLFFTSDKTYTKFATWIYLPFILILSLVTLCLPFLLGYFAFLASNLHQPAFFLLCCLAMSAFVLFGLWTDKYLSKWQKSIYSLLLPITFFAFYTFLIMRVLATLWLFTSYLLTTQLYPRLRKAR